MDLRRGPRRRDRRIPRGVPVADGPESGLLPFHRRRSRLARAGSRRGALSAIFSSKRRSQGCHEVLAVTAPTNRGSIAFHTRHGISQSCRGRAARARFRSLRTMMARARTGSGSGNHLTRPIGALVVDLTIEYVNGLWYSPAPACGRITQIWVLRGTRPVAQRGSDRRIQRPQAARGFCAESRASEPVTERSNHGRAGEGETPRQRRDRKAMVGAVRFSKFAV